MSSKPEPTIERRDAGTLVQDQRFCWHNRWYVVGTILDRSMAICLDPNAPDGEPTKSGHAPPLSPIQVDVLVS